jgi:hypothetical protein
MTEEQGAAELVEQLAEKLKVPELPPGYLSVAPPTNHAMRRKAKQMAARAQKHRRTWARQLLAVGINPEDVLAERRRKALERAKKNAKPVKGAGEGTRQAA